jgi:hypothetical protein
LSWTRSTSSRPDGRYEERDPSITYVGIWTSHNDSRVWSEGSTATSKPTRFDRDLHLQRHVGELDRLQEGQCRRHRQVHLDGVFQREIRLAETYPTEGYQ